MKNELKMKETPLPIGERKIGDKDYFISFALTQKPNWFRRVMANLFFGLKWIDFEGPKEVKDITPSKGIKSGVTKVIEPSKRIRR